MKCAARQSNLAANDPQDCDAPFCGCNPAWSECLEMLREIGVLGEIGEPLASMHNVIQKPPGDWSQEDYEEETPLVRASDYQTLLNRAVQLQHALLMAASLRESDLDEADHFVNEWRDICI